MSGCPVHIWAPMIAAALPFSRAVRDRVRTALGTRRRQQPVPPSPREVQRWAPVGTSAANENPINR